MFLFFKKKTKIKLYGIQLINSNHQPDKQCLHAFNANDINLENTKQVNPPFFEITWQLNCRG